MTPMACSRDEATDRREAALTTQSEAREGITLVREAYRSVLSWSGSTSISGPIVGGWAFAVGWQDADQRGFETRRSGDVVVFGHGHSFPMMARMVLASPGLVWPWQTAGLQLCAPAPWRT